MGVILRLAAWEARRRPGHTAIIVAAVTIGAALVTAIQTVNGSTQASLDEAVATLTGEAQLQVRARGDNLAEDVLEKVRGQPGVAHASPLVSGTLWVTEGGAQSETLSVFGVDLGDDRSVRTYRITNGNTADVVDDSLVFLAQPDSVVLSDDFMQHFGIARGDRLVVLGPTGKRTLTVRGSLAPQGMGTLFGGSLAVMDVFAAQRLLGRDGLFDQVDVVAGAGEDVEAMKTRLRAVLPSNLEVIAPQQRGAATERILRAFQGLLAGFSMLGLIFGAFVSYNVAATMIAARLVELGTLRCVGASRRQMRLLALATVALPAAGASVIGIGLGALLAKALVQPLTHTISYGARITLSVPETHVPLAAVPLALLAGIGAALVGAWSPAAAAARIAPREVGRAPDSVSGRRLGGLGIAALGVAALGLAAAMATESGALAGIAVLFIIVALALLSLAALPILRVPLERALALAGGHGLIAADALAQAPLRAGVTVTVISMALAMTLTLGCVTASFKGSVLDYLKGLVAADLIVTSPFHEEAWIEAPIAESVGEEVRGVPGVDRVATERFVNVIREDERITIHAVDRAFFEEPRFGHWLFHAGDPTTALPAAAAGEGFLVSDNLARRHGLEPGSPFAIETPAGTLTRPVLGIVTEYVSETGTVIMQRDLYRAHWHDALINRVFVLAGNGTPVEQLRDAIGRNFVGKFPLRMLTASEFRARFERELDGVFAFLIALRGLMVALAVLGVADTLLGLGLARAREIGVLRALGMRRRGAYGLFALEAAGLAGVGIGIGLAGALVLSAIWVRVSLTYQLGWQLNLYMPWVQYGLWAAAMWLLSTLAALIPVRSIAGRATAELLAYE